MPTRPQITAFLGLSVAFWAGLLALRGVPMTWELLLPFGSVVGAVSLTLVIFDEWAWKLPIFRGWLIKRPVLHGTWKAVLQSGWINPETKQGIAPISCYIVVRQSASKLSIRLVTSESRSETVSAGVEVCSDGTFEISCTYRNQPKSIYRHRSELHYGALLIAADRARPTRLEGEYWTDRKTTGLVAMSECSPKTVSTFDEAQALFSESPKRAP